MRQDELQTLFYSFIKYRQADEVDGLGNLAEYEDPLRIPGDFVVHPFGQVQQAPLQLFPFELPPGQANASAAAGQTLAHMAEEFTNLHYQPDVIKFEKSSLIVSPEQQTIFVSVIRSDNYVNRTMKITWKTSDKTAKSGIHYVGSTGEVIFNQGEAKKEIEIQILKSVDDAIDLRFKVKLEDVSGVLNLSPMTIILKKIDQYSDEERGAIRDLLQSVPLSVDAVRFILESSLSPRTFHVALSHLCSPLEDVKAELALAFDLSRLFISNYRPDHIMGVLTDFFRTDEIEF